MTEIVSVAISPSH